MGGGGGGLLSSELGGLLLQRFSTAGFDDTVFCCVNLYCGILLSAMFVY